MDAENPQPLKLASAIVAGVIILVVGYKIATRPDLPTQIAQVHASAMFPDGEPSASLLAAGVAKNISAADASRSLAEFQSSILKKGGNVSWEPINEYTFIMRIDIGDSLTGQTNSYGIEFLYGSSKDLHSTDPRWSHFVVPNRAVANGQIVNYRFAWMLIDNL